VGLLLWGRDQAGTQPPPVRKDKKGGEWGDRFGGFFKTLLPDRNG
jgi:hypothetical protein